MSEYVFSYKWFNQYTLPIWKKLLLPHLGPVRSYCEIGVAEGNSLIWVLENLKPRHATGVDTYWPARNFGDHPREAKQRQQRMVDNLSLWSGEPSQQNPQSVYTFRKPDGPTCEVYIQGSESYLLDNNSQKFDLAYVDGSHNANDALTDIILSWRLLEVGGIMVVDDLDQRYRGNRPRAWHAVRAFQDCYDSLFDTLFVHQRQAAFRKIERRRSGHPPVLSYGPAIVPLT